MMIQLPAISARASSSNTESAQNDLPPVSPFRKKICGDIFGSSMGGENSMLGMLYRSRVQEKMMKNKKSTRQDERIDDVAVEDQSIEPIDVFDGSSDSENEVDEVINPRHRLALTIRNWSVNSDNDDYLLQEGAVHALIALAGTEDHRIKQCCASALYHLSCREANRAELMSLGAATGVITIAMKIAKLCAQTLCNLSMQPGGESTMAKEGAVLALVILLGVRNQRLAPTCVQTLYNLTCVEEMFKGMERIVKALLTLPNVNFDATPAIVGGIRNCSRFPVLRMRIIEDGILQTFSAVVNSLSHRDNADERISIVLNIATCIAQLSDQMVCRSDMISKGSIELLQQLLPYCNDTSRLLVIKSLHNLLAVIHTFPSTIFEIGVNVVTDVIHQTFDEITLQYAASCFHMFTKENMRGIPRLAIRVVKSLPRLLLCSNPLSQYYSIMTTSMMFFSDLIEDTSLLMVLAGKAVQAGYTVRDPSSIRALVQAFAMLTQESKYIQELEREKLLNEMLNLNLTLIENGKTDPRVLESCCVGVCRISLQTRDLDASRRQRVAQMLFDMLDNDDEKVLSNATSSIRALLEKGICHQELLSDSLISRIANITVRFADDTQLSRFGCAVLTVLSYDKAAHVGLSDDSVLGVLFQMTRADDIMTRELVATCICNISIDDACRKSMIEKGIVDVIESLSGATSERIQELCAKSICNLTCTVEMHGLMIENNILQTTLMIALVRSVSNCTKQLCVRALLNMVSDENMDAIVEAGVIHAFSMMSLLDDSHTQYICARGFLMLSASTKGRETIVSKRSVLQSLFALVKAFSGKTRVLMGMAVFNLLADGVSRAPVIRAGGLSVLKIIATLEYENLREGTARVIIILAQAPELQVYVSREPIVPVLVLVAKTSSRVAFECALNAFSVLSQSDSYRQTLIEKGCVSSLVGAVVEGKVTTVELAEEVCRCLCLLSLSKDHAEQMLEAEHAMMALHILHRQSLISHKSADMIAMLLRNLSCTSKVCKYIMEQEGLSLLQSLMESIDPMSTVFTSAAMLLFHNMGKDLDLHTTLVSGGMMKMIRAVTDSAQLAVVHIDDDDLTVEEGDITATDGTKEPDREQDTGDDSDFAKNQAAKLRKLGQDTIYDIVMAIQLVSLTPSVREEVVGGRVVQVFLSVLQGLNDVIRHEMVCALGNLASSRECREPLVAQGAIDLLVILSQSPYADTQSQCATALGHLSENTHVKQGTVASLLVLALKAEEVKDSVQQNTAVSRRSSTAMTNSGMVQGSVSSNMSAVSAPAKELMAMQNIKSLKVMIRDGLMRQREKHGVPIYDENDSVSQSSLSIGSFRGTSLEDLNEVGYYNLTEEEKLVLEREYSALEYCITEHPVSQEPGGMSAQVKVELPYPTVCMRDIETSDPTESVIEVTITQECLPKNTAETKIHELTRYASNVSETNDDDDLQRSWNGPPKNSPAVRKKKKTRKLQTAKSVPSGSSVWKTVPSKAITSSGKISH